MRRIIICEILKKIEISKDTETIAFKISLTIIVSFGAKDPTYLVVKEVFN